MNKKLNLMTLICLLLWFAMINYRFVFTQFKNVLWYQILQFSIFILFLSYFLLKFYFILKWNIKNIFKFSFLIFSSLFFILFNWLDYYFFWDRSITYIEDITHPFFNSIFFIFESFFLFLVMKSYFNIFEFKKLLNFQKISIYIQIIVLILISIFTWKYFLFWIDSSYDFYELNIILLSWLNVLILLYIIIVSLYSYFKLKKIKKSDQDYQETQ